MTEPGTIVMAVASRRITDAHREFLHPSVITRWRRGEDTFAIAKHFGVPEADICRIVSLDQDRRHASRSVRTADLAKSRNTPF